MVTDPTDGGGKGACRNAVANQPDGVGERGKVEFHAANAGPYLAERLPHRPESLGGFTSGFFEAVETLA